MAQCKLTPREFIANAFSPQIAAVCSDIAEATCQKNNLSFVELLQPFCKLNTEGHIKDPQGNTVVIRNLRLSIQDLNATPLEPSNARRLLNESVSSASCEHTANVQIGTTDLIIPLTVPWFEGWRETFLSVQSPSSHEFMKHFLACMLVVSTAEHDPLEKIQSMGMQLYQGASGKSSKWFNNNTLRYYVLIHDAVQDDKNKAEAVYSEIKNIYGANNCFLLQINSRLPGQSDDNIHLPDPWSQFLNKFSDVSGITDQNSSPRTPADAGGVSSMPSALTTDSDKFSQVAAPINAQNYALASPEETVNLSPMTSETTSGQLEIGQEAIPTKAHPLSPDENEKSVWFGTRIYLGDETVSGSPINHNVWANSPNHPCAQHGSRLSTQDVERLRALITEFTLKSLLPYVEKQIGLLNDVISNKKGVSRSLFSATKRWFGTNKPGVPGSAPLNTVIYSGESPELQMRRLGDLCFMFGHYSLAYQAYHSVKRDFAADQAWLYYAGALEMAALSAFMQGEMNRKTIEYMEDAILTYSNSCKLPQFATRATLLSTECLKGRGLYGEAAKQLIRMTSEDSDLRSAILLEQAAYCFIGPKMMRKYAFHAVLAGHRFSKAGQKKHSLRCYQQAYQVYYNRGWSLAEDHIHFTIGRQAASLKLVHEAVKAFEKLLSITSKQPAPQQAAFLREFLHTHNLLLDENSARQRKLPVLPLPTVEGNEIKLLFGHLAKPDGDNIPATHVSFDDKDCDDVRWSKMEEILLTEVQGSTMIFKPTIALHSRTSNNTAKPYGIVNEPVHLNVELYNPLRIPLLLCHVTILWSFKNEERTVGNETNMHDLEIEPVDAQRIDVIAIQPTCKQSITLSLTPRMVGHLKILGLTYRLSSPNSTSADQCTTNLPSTAIAGKILFDIQGPRLKNAKEKPGAPAYGTDYRLEVNVIEKAPFMQICFSKLSSDVLCGEIQNVQVTLKNIGNAPLRNIHVTCTDPKLYSIGEQRIHLDKDEIMCRSNTSPVTRISLPSSMGEILRVGQVHKFPLWIQAPYAKGLHRLDLMFYYENVEVKGVPKYRLCRHSWYSTVSDSLQISACVYKSALFDDSSSTLNLVAHVKNVNQVHGPFINEICLTDVSLRSDDWSILDSSVVPFNVKIQPQETFHFLLKLRGKLKGDPAISRVILSREMAGGETLSTDIPYMDFIQKRNVPRLEICENVAGSSQPQQPLHKSLDGFSEQKVLSSSMMLKGALILRWGADIFDKGVINRRVTGHHHLDLGLLNKTYTHPKQIENVQTGYGEHLMVFGPERHISAGVTVAASNQHDYADTEFRKNLVAFTLSHDREVVHRFARNRLCIVPVLVCIQNYLGLRVDVKITTIGSSSQSHLPSMKSQLYSAQASTYFRYACQTAILHEIEPRGRQRVKLQAVLPAPGTYDLASRIQIAARVGHVHNIVDGTAEFVPQKWRMESVCIVNNDRV